MLVKAWHTNLPFPEFCNKVRDLYGPDRKHLLAGRQLFACINGIPVNKIKLLLDEILVLNMTWFSIKFCITILDFNESWQCDRTMSLNFDASIRLALPGWREFNVPYVKHKLTQRCKIFVLIVSHMLRLRIRKYLWKYFEGCWSLIYLHPLIHNGLGAFLVHLITISCTLQFNFDDDDNDDDDGDSINRQDMMWMMTMTHGSCLFLCTVDRHEAIHTSQGFVILWMLHQRSWCETRAHGICSSVLQVWFTFNIINTCGLATYNYTDVVFCNWLLSKTRPWSGWYEV